MADKLDDQQLNMSLSVLNVSSRRNLSLFLNLESQGEDIKDYTRLAELIGFEYREIMNFARLKDPTSAVLQEWLQRDVLQPTIGKLLEYLEEMERKDIISDCVPLFIKDIDNYMKRKNINKHDKSSPLQDGTVSQSSSNSCSSDVQSYNKDDDVDETWMMTVDDVEHGQPQFYHAFICYSPEGDDIKFVKLMISVLENDPYNLRLFVPGRNDLSGSSRHTIDAALIEYRCKRMVIIMSSTYLQSQACDFQTKFAQSLSPGSRSKKLVPVKIEDCQIPSILRHITMCDYTKKDLQEWFWKRLVESIRAPYDSKQCQYSGISLSDLKLNITGNYKEICSNNSSSNNSSSNQSSSNQSSSNNSSSNHYSHITNSSC